MPLFAHNTPECKLSDRRAGISTFCGGRELTRVTMCAGTKQFNVTGFVPSGTAERVALTRALAHRVANEELPCQRMDTLFNRCAFRALRNVICCN